MQGVRIQSLQGIMISFVVCRGQHTGPCCYHCNLRLHLLKGHCWGRGVLCKTAVLFWVHLEVGSVNSLKEELFADWKFTRKQQIGARMTSGNGRSSENSGKIGRDVDFLKWRKGIWVKLKDHTTSLSWGFGIRRLLKYCFIKKRNTIW